MAILNDLLVNGISRLIGNVNVSGTLTLAADPTANLQAATKQYVDNAISGIPAGSDEKLRVGALSSAVTYYPILAASTALTDPLTRQVDSSTPAFTYVKTNGTNGTEGTAVLTLGNTTTSGTAGNATGQLILRDYYGVGATIAPRAGGGRSNNTMMYLPNWSGSAEYLISSQSSSGVGSATQPVYVDSGGHVQAANQNLWGFSSSNGIFYPYNMIDTTHFSNGSIGVLHSDNYNVQGLYNGQCSLTLFGGGNVTLYEGVTQNVTTYKITGFEGIGANKIGSNYVSNMYFWSTQNRTVQKPTSVTISDNYTTVTFTNSLNPDSALTTSDRLLMISSNNGAANIVGGIGNVIEAGGCNIIGGNKNFNTGWYAVVGGLRNENSGNGGIVFGRGNINSGIYNVTIGERNTNTKTSSFVAGRFHDTTNGPDYLAAVGYYSSITSTSAFVVGNGTAADARSNAFEVHTDGTATVGAGPVNNLDVATKQYVDSRTHWTTSIGGGIYYNTAGLINDVDIKPGNVLIRCTNTNGDAVKTSIENVNFLMLGLIYGEFETTPAPAGSTTYTLKANVNIPLTDGDCTPYSDTYYYIRGEQAAAQKPTSVTVNNNIITLTFASTLNPANSATRIYQGIEVTGSSNIVSGAGLKCTSYSLNVGVKNVSTSGYNLCIGTIQYVTAQNNFLLGTVNKSTGRYSTLLGTRHVNAVTDALLAGRGHDSTNGPAGVAAVGEWSSITSTTAFAVGNGTAANARSNAFEVTTTGTAKVVGLQIGAASEIKSIGTGLAIDANGALYATGGGGGGTVDSARSTSSTNALQNSVITNFTQTLPLPVYTTAGATPTSAVTCAVNSNSMVGDKIITQDGWIGTISSITYMAGIYSASANITNTNWMAPRRVTVGTSQYNITRKALEIVDGNTTTTYYIADIT